MSVENLISELQARLEELESRVAFQEDALQTLSEQLAHQQGVTEQQQQMMQVIYRQLRDMREMDAAQAGPADALLEKPPHY